MYLIIGLGNPGKEYENTRHNFGWMVLDELTDKWRSDKKLKADLADLAVLAKKIILAKPQTFMNNSGVSVQAIMQFYKIPTSNLIVVHDDLDLPLGEEKISTNSGAAGHHGVESIIESLGTKEFTRLRLGIGPRPTEIPGDKFVLQKFSPDEQTVVKQVVKQATEKILTAIS